MAIRPFSNTSFINGLEGDRPRRTFQMFDETVGILPPSNCAVCEFAGLPL
jgi:hypothetical protein